MYRLCFTLQQLSDLMRRCGRSQLHCMCNSLPFTAVDSQSQISVFALSLHSLAMEMNVLGVRRAIQVCRKFSQLEVFVHVSTAYSNCDRTYIEEVIYPPPVDPQHLLDALEWLDDEMMEAITPKLLGDKPNTYTYTKHLAECLLIREGSDLPLAIVRPSIVTAAWREPIPVSCERCLPVRWPLTFGMCYRSSAVPVGALIAEVDFCMF